VSSPSTSLASAKQRLIPSNAERSILFVSRQTARSFAIYPDPREYAIANPDGGYDVESAIVKSVIVSIDFGTKLAQIEGASFRLRKTRDVIDQKTERSAAKEGQAAERGLVGEVLGHGLFRMSPDEVPALRRKPCPVAPGWGPPAPSLLRNSDEQTIAGLCAVFTAIASMRLARDRYEGWGVIAASRFLGRANLARALQSFLAEGVWGTSPHLIPHFALHSASGTISLGLELRGPNLGVGGGLHAAAEGFLTALTWLSSGVVSGVWLILSGWSPELVPDRSGGPPRAMECQALAIALGARGPSGGRLAFRACLGVETRPAAAPIDLLALAEDLATGTGAVARTVATDPLGRLRIELTDGALGPG
jgi:hypothetical protein